MTTLAERTGTWAGTNGFRLVPADPLADRPATATLTLAAGGHLISLAYTWEHPDDGPQDGLLVVGSGREDPAVVALWGDSWHQQPAPMSMTGTVEGGSIELEDEYGGGWRWRIMVEAARPDALRMQMDNVVPADDASAELRSGPYPAMVMNLHRT